MEAKEGLFISERKKSESLDGNEVHRKKSSVNFNLARTN